MRADGSLQPILAGGEASLVLRQGGAHRPIFAAGGALVRESGVQIACRWGWGGDFCTSWREPRCESETAR